MSGTFRSWHVDQLWRLPPSLQDLVPVGHMAQFVRDTVRTGLDLSEIMDANEEERGYTPYHPAMTVALLLDGYVQGVYSSRNVARACEERLDFAAVTGLQYPDFRTVSEFRKQHLQAQFAPLLAAIKGNLGHNPAEVSAGDMGGRSIGRQAGFADGVIEDLRHGSADALSERGRCVLIAMMFGQGSMRRSGDAARRVGGNPTTGCRLLACGVR